MYVTGFVDGNGSFTYGRSGRQLALYFAVKLATADRRVLEDLQAYFRGAGRIYAVAPAGASLYYRISHRTDLMEVVRHFDAHPLRTRKRDAYAIWRDMVIAKQQFRTPDRALLDRLAAQLSALTR